MSHPPSVAAHLPRVGYGSSCFLVVAQGLAKSLLRLVGVPVFLEKLPNFDLQRAGFLSVGRTVPVIFQHLAPTGDCLRQEFSAVVALPKGAKASPQVSLDGGQPASRGHGAGKNLLELLGLREGIAVDSLRLRGPFPFLQVFAE